MHIGQQRQKNLEGGSGNLGREFPSDQSFGLTQASQATASRGDFDRETGESGGALAPCRIRPGTHRNRIIAHLALDPSTVPSIATQYDSFLKYLESCLTKSPLMPKRRITRNARRNESRSGLRQLAEQPHQATDSDLSHQESVELLAHQSGVLLRSTILAPRRWVLSPSNTVSISRRS